MHLAAQEVSHSLDESEELRYQILVDDPEFSKITQLIKTSDEITALLNSNSSNLTSLATPNWALHPHRGAHPGHELAPECEHSVTPTLSELAALVDHFPEEKDDQLQEVVDTILAYHILSVSVSVDALTVENATYPTWLTLPNTEQLQRIQIARSCRSPRTTVNMLSKIVWENIPATNGVIHVVNRPLARPSSILDSLCKAPVFSTLVVQREHASTSTFVDGNYSGTLFAPTDRAFEHLPQSLREFLFSPEGTHVLQKLLEFHVIPGVVVHSGVGTGVLPIAPSHPLVPARASMPPVVDTKHIPEESQQGRPDRGEAKGSTHGPSRVHGESGSEIRGKSNHHERMKGGRRALSAGWSPSKRFAQLLHTAGLAREDLGTSADAPPCVNLFLSPAPAGWDDWFPQWAESQA
ncbi:hypothetical protein DFH07DRAFT_974339 [Mycena maculata]|uniref:FAS1 domain-containing protein n=1 Tax=Mycena maculata TaxID=230809 RepID=A0AAD7MFA1_9AGAR|nr:hypothetical protein DFH07DRAFT_974339 [Mycena maculata]